MVTVGDSLDASFIITNVGGDTLSGSVSEACDHYSIVSGGGAYALAAGETVTVNVRYQPTSLGSHNCSIETGDTLCTDVVCTGGGGPTGIGPTPLRFALEQNYPNPFNPTTTIAFTLPVKVHTNLSIFNLRGKLVRTLVNEVLTEGQKQAEWDGRDARGNPVTSGVYFYRLEAGSKVMTRKMVLIK